MNLPNLWLPRLPGPGEIDGVLFGKTLTLSKSLLNNSSESACVVVPLDILMISVQIFDHAALFGQRNVIPSCAKRTDKYLALDESGDEANP